jgi:hypothetical protein
VWHWAHQRGRICDKWWENETNWHRAWKGQFPNDWQEIVHRADSGEKHIADVKTPAGWAIEFQHSYIGPEERRSRNAFYGKLIWVVDATRRRKDIPQLLKSWEEGTPLGANSAVRRVWSEGCTLYREWADSHAPTFFDFDDSDSLWWLLKASRDQWAYVAKFPRTQFLLIHRGTGEAAFRAFAQFVEDLDALVERYESRASSLSTSQPFRGFEGYLTRRKRLTRF